MNRTAVADRTRPRTPVEQTRPNCFIVGAPKCGTTSLYHYLRQHPDVFMSVPKEPVYFGRDLRSHALHTRSAEEYRSFFADADGEPVRGEATVWYLYSRHAAREIHSFNPTARNLILLRNPVDAMHSLHSHMLYTGNESLRSFREALDAEPRRKRTGEGPKSAYYPEGLYYREVYRYPEQIRRYRRWFDPDQLKILTLDQLKRDTRGLFREVLSFLNVDPEFEPEFRRHNPSCQIQSPLVRNVVQNLTGETLQACRTVVSKKLCSTVWEQIKPLVVEPLDRPSLDPSLRRSLTDEFRDDIRDLNRMLDVDVTHWLDPVDD